MKRARGVERITAKVSTAARAPDTVAHAHTLRLRHACVASVAAVLFAAPLARVVWRRRGDAAGSGPTGALDASTIAAGGRGGTPAVTGARRRRRPRRRRLSGGGDGLHGERAVLQRPLRAGDGAWPASCSARTPASPTAWRARRRSTAARSAASAAAVAAGCARSRARACTANADCCSNICQGGQCQVDLANRNCRPTGETCTSGSGRGCCTDVCDETVDPKRCRFGSETCRGEGAACTTRRAVLPRRLRSHDARCARRRARRWVARARTTRAAAPAPARPGAARCRPRAARRSAARARRARSAARASASAASASRGSSSAEFNRRRGRRHQ